MTASIINTIGLIFDISGVVLVFFFGFPQPNLEDPHPPVLGLDGVFPAYEKELEETRKKRKLYLRMSRFALCLIVIGFILQVASDWI